MDSASRYCPETSEVDFLIINPSPGINRAGSGQLSDCRVLRAGVQSLYFMAGATPSMALGQTQPVKVVFAVYMDAIEAQALDLMGHKMRAAQTLYGDEVGGAIVPVEYGDFITELAREALRGAGLDDLPTRCGYRTRPWAARLRSTRCCSPCVPRLSWNGHWNTKQRKQLLGEGPQVSEVVSSSLASCPFGRTSRKLRVDIK